MVPQARITSQISSLGQNLLTLFAGSKRAGGVNSGMGSASTITVQDADAIARESLAMWWPSVPKIPRPHRPLPTAATGPRRSSGNRRSISGSCAWKLASGTMFTQRDVHTAGKVAVIGSKTANELVRPLNPVGQSIRIRNIPFVIIGLLESKGAGMGGQNQDDRIIIPFTTAMKRITGNKYLRSINVQVVSADRMDSAGRLSRTCSGSATASPRARRAISTFSTRRKSPTPSAR